MIFHDIPHAAASRTSCGTALIVRTGIEQRTSPWALVNTSTIDHSTKRFLVGRSLESGRRRYPCAKSNGDFTPWANQASGLQAAITSHKLVYSATCQQHAASRQTLLAWLGLACANLETLWRPNSIVLCGEHRTLELCSGLTPQWADGIRHGARQLALNLQCTNQWGGKMR